MGRFNTVMARVLSVMVVIILSASLASLSTLRKVSEESHEQYARAAVVSEVNEQENIVTFVDGCGLQWEIKGVFDWEIGDLAALLMDDNGTSGTIEDDIILDVWYSALGWQIREGFLD